VISLIDIPMRPTAVCMKSWLATFSKQIASALQYLRKHNLVHRDIKPQDLLSNPPPTYMQQHKSRNSISMEEIPHYGPKLQYDNDSIHIVADIFRTRPSA
jgi:serine/threonine protein kinase